MAKDKYNHSYIFLDIFPRFYRNSEPALLVLELHVRILGGKLVLEL